MPLQQLNLDPAVTPAYMRAVAAVESDYDPRNRTGSYAGLYQMGNNPNGARRARGGRARIDDGGSPNQQPQRQPEMSPASV